MRTVITLLFLKRKFSVETGATHLVLLSPPCWKGLNLLKFGPASCPPDLYLPQHRLHSPLILQDILSSPFVTVTELDPADTSVQFSRSVVSNSLRPHESQHARPPCPSPTPGVPLRFTSIKSVMPSSHLILGRLLLVLPPIPPSIRLFQ